LKVDEVYSKTDRSRDPPRALPVFGGLDARLSANGSVSCASCHHPELAFTDGLQKSLGVGGRMGTRNAPSLWNAALLPNQFWDGRQPTHVLQAIAAYERTNVR
jgi:cytochrome c peroxidase